MTKDEALRLALEFIASINPAFTCEAIHHSKKERHEIFEPCPHVAKQKQVYEAIKAALEAKDEPDAYGYAKRLAEAIWSKHYKTIAPQWEPFDELIGVLTQIDNMTSGLISKPQQEAKDEPVGFKIYKPTPPRGAIPNVRDAELPWVYDQDPSSGNVASMWVTPVQTLRSKS